MWELYSSNHTGFCVGFNTKIMFEHLGGGAPVVYCDELPIIKPIPWDNPTAQTFKQVYYKLREWDFEEEYRTQLFSLNPLKISDRIITLPSEAYKEVIFGANISNSFREEIISITKKLLPHVVFRQASIAGDSILINLIN